MTSDEPQYAFGLPGEIAEVFGQEIDDWDEWQLEDMLSSAQYAIAEREAAVAADPWAQEQAFLAAFMAQALVEEEPWGIDEPMTEADWAWLEEEWPEA
jgi:hypothetical protein